VKVALHITNGGSAAGIMKVAGIGGQILPWRDALHDGPVPGGLSLAELSRVRASYFASVGMDRFEDAVREFVARDSILQRFGEYEPVVLWFEWDLYDQLQLIQVLDAIAGGLDDSRVPPTLEIVSLAGYLGTLQPEDFPTLYERRTGITAEMLSLGQRSWTAFTSPDPRDVVALLVTDTAALPFLEGALWRLLEELPSTRGGLSRSERQLLEGLSNGPSTFGDIFRSAAGREERMYCGDASAALYLERLSRGDEPLVVFPSGDRVAAPLTEAGYREFGEAQLTLTDAGRAVLAGERDWIEMGGSDRWLGGVNLDGRNAVWRWDPEQRTIIEVHVE
jgi:hypothetical protein